MVIAVTNKRILQFDKRIGRSSSTKEISPSAITSISINKDFGFENLTMTVSNSKMQIQNLYAGKAQEIVTAIKQLQEQTENYPTTSSAQSNFNNLEDLEILARLHQQGIITEEEFHQTKKRILGF